MTASVGSIWLHAGKFHLDVRSRLASLIARALASSCTSDAARTTPHTPHCPTTHGWVLFWVCKKMCWFLSRTNPKKHDPSATGSEPGWVVHRRQRTRPGSWLCGPDLGELLAGGPACHPPAPLLAGLRMLLIAPHPTSRAQCPGIPDGILEGGHMRIQPKRRQAPRFSCSTCTVRRA